MPTYREASNTSASSFSRPVPQRSADFVESPQASPSAAESFSEPSPTVRAWAKCAWSPFSVLKRVESKADAPTPIMGGGQRGQTAVKREQAHHLFHEPATGSGRSRAV